MSLKDILKGHMKEFKKENDDLYEKRISICEKCPLFKMTSVGPICNSLKYLDKDLDIAFPTDGPNRTKGCGCRLNAKTRIEDATCPVGKW